MEGADRFRYKYQNYQNLVDRLFVSVCSFKCDVKAKTPENLRIMGEVAKFEYECFATYVEKFSCLPEFNDKIKSPKFSLTKSSSQNQLYTQDDKSFRTISSDKKLIDYS